MSSRHCLDDPQHSLLQILGRQTKRLAIIRLGIPRGCAVRPKNCRLDEREEHFRRPFSLEESLPVLLLHFRPILLHDLKLSKLLLDDGEDVTLVEEKVVNLEHLVFRVLGVLEGRYCSFTDIFDVGDVELWVAVIKECDLLILPIEAKESELQACNNSQDPSA